jgi:hypothetical protein
VLQVSLFSLIITASLYAYSSRQTFPCISTPRPISNKKFLLTTFVIYVYIKLCRSQWPRGLRRGSAAIRLRGLWVRIPPVVWMSVSCERCMLSGRVLCVGLITRPEESYWMWCESVIMKLRWWGGPCPTGGCCIVRKICIIVATNELYVCHCVCVYVCVWRTRT